ncbi:BolA family protein [Falsirhodobacter algicola]|uniref:BolA/IbaG family iron-sulfur metabolism protein n=1 Tax=Falsirhodobacter algicola TaxID=2692330 RepID=A0A8J8MSD7_9RHOB|nr:BolA family protein [Falsirhodobacter algicola]QUS35587.1 BolA/IbaG family iron-sulfur metabolism protein [Falsirhodobacter algicola]
MRTVDEIHERLTAAFTPTVLEVEDESEMHRGHSGFREGGESHFRVVIRAPALAGMGRIARHRAIHQALGPIMTRIHALAVDAA